MNIVLMAGGGGTRLWPLSRISKPKQFIDLGHGHTLLQAAFKRALELTTIDHIYIATANQYESLIKEQLPDVKDSHIFYEPEKRDTTAAFATVALRLQQIEQGKTPTTFMWADHVFTNEEEFLTDLRTIPELIEQNPNNIIVVGHAPISPETALGYIETGDNISGHNNVFEVKCFKEKPDLQTAKKFLSAGNYFWNLGYFSLKPDYFIEELTRLNPDLTPIIKQFAQALRKTPNDTKQVYHKFPKISIEYTLIEKTERRLAVTGDYGWTDVGYWTTVEEIFGQSGDHAPHGHHIHVNSKGNYIYNTTKKTVSLLGIKNSIIVVTDDAILITSKKDCGDIKKVIAELENTEKTDVL